MIKKAIIPFISVLFFSYLSAKGFQFSQTIIFDNNLGNVPPVVLTFGFSPDATDESDTGYCSDPEYSGYFPCLGAGETWYFDAYAPPAPPPPAFDAALGWNGNRYYAQIVAGLAEDVDVEHVWDIQLQYGDNNTINLTWDTTGLSDLGTFILQDAFGGLFVNIDMIDGSGTVNGEYASLDNSDPSHPILSIFNTAVNTLKLKVTPNGNSLSTIENFGTIPAEFSLYGNYPNPFNPVTNIRYSLSSRADVTVSVYNIMGQKISDLVNSYHDAGFYQASWDGKNNVGKSLPSGIYIYTVSKNNKSLTGKMLLMK